MTTAALLLAAPRPIEPPVEDRLRSVSLPVRDMSAVTLGVLAGSIIAHGLLLLVTVVVGWQASPPAPREIAVEIVQEQPKPPPPQPLQHAPHTAAQKPPPPPPPPPPQQQQQQQQQKNETKALQQELTKLQAERAALKAARGEQQAGFERAIAMPSLGAGDGDAVSYDQLVFSQLAKAKGEQENLGQPGVTCVKFEMDRQGRLVSVEVVTPSGNAKLDARALEIVRRAAPFPPPPTDADRIVFANVNFEPPSTP